MKKCMIAFAIVLAVPAIGFFLAPSYVKPAGERLAGRVYDKAGPILSERHQMQACGTYLSCPDGPLKSLGLPFQAYRAMSREEARVVALDCAHTILEILHADEEAHSAMAHYPFRLGDVKVVIFMSDAMGNTIYAPDFWCASFAKGKLIFYSDDPGEVAEYLDGRTHQMGKSRTPITEVIEKWVEPKDRENTQMIRKGEQPNPDGKG